jgi:hypothetical protein
MSTPHTVEIFVNGWSLMQLQRAIDAVYNRTGGNVKKIICSHARRRELIHALDLERKLNGYHTAVNDIDVAIQAERDFNPDRAALIFNDAEPALWFDFKSGWCENAEGDVVYA